MNFLDDPKIILGFIMIFFVITYFYINYQVNISIKSELMRIKKHKYLKARHQQKKQQHIQKSDMDSYYDPAEDDGMRDDVDDYQGDVRHEREERLTKDNILMRDMMGL